MLAPPPSGSTKIRKQQARALLRMRAALRLHEHMLKDAAKGGGWMASQHARLRWERAWRGWCVKSLHADVLGTLDVDAIVEQQMASRISKAATPPDPGDREKPGPVGQPPDRHPPDKQVPLTQREIDLALQAQADAESGASQAAGQKQGTNVQQDVTNFFAGPGDELVGLATGGHGDKPSAGGPSEDTVIRERVQQQIAREREHAQALQQIKASMMAQLDIGSPEFWTQGPGSNAIQAYVQMALAEGEDAGQYSLDALGLNERFAWANERAQGQDLMAVRGSKVVMHAADTHLDTLTNIIADATRPTQPLGVDAVKAQVQAQWTDLKGYQAERIARTETANVWEATHYNTMAANGVEQYSVLLADSASNAEAMNLTACEVCIAAAAAGAAFDIEDAGNVPPYHPNCRCTAVPKLDVVDPHTGEERPWLPPQEPWTGQDHPGLGPLPDPGRPMLAAEPYRPGPTSEHPPAQYRNERRPAARTNEHKPSFSGHGATEHSHVHEAPSSSPPGSGGRYHLVDNEGRVIQESDYPHSLRSYRSRKMTADERANSKIVDTNPGAEPPAPRVPAERPPEPGADVTLSEPVAEARAPRGPDGVGEQSDGFTITLTQGQHSIQVWAEGSLQRATDQARILAEDLKVLPERVWGRTTDINLWDVGQHSPWDAEHAVLNGEPSWRAAATASKDGRIDFWDGNYKTRTLDHELGHVVGDTKTIPTPTLAERKALPEGWFNQTRANNGPLDPAAWMGAAMKDRKTTESYFREHSFMDRRGTWTPDDQYSRGAHRILGPDDMTGGITPYGSTVMQEDWAESLSAYLHDKREGQIGRVFQSSKRDEQGHVLWEGGSQPVRFKDLYPERAKLFDKMFAEKYVPEEKFNANWLADGRDTWRAGRTYGNGATREMTITRRTDAEVKQGQFRYGVTDANGESFGGFTNVNDARDAAERVLAEPPPVAVPKVEAPTEFTPPTDHPFTEGPRPNEFTFGKVGGLHLGERDDEWWKARNLYVVDDEKTLANLAKLREGGPTTGWSRRVDALVVNDRITQDGTVFRAAMLDPATIRELDPGTAFTDRGFMSVSPDMRLVDQYKGIRGEQMAGQGKEQVVFHIKLGDGNTVGVMDTNPTGEWVMPRNTEMQVLGRAWNDEQKQWDVWVDARPAEARAAAAPAAGAVVPGEVPVGRYVLVDGKGNVRAVSDYQHSLRAFKSRRFSESEKPGAKILDTHARDYVQLPGAPAPVLGTSVIGERAAAYVQVKLGGATKADVADRLRRALINVAAQKQRGKFTADEAKAFKDALRAEHDRIMAEPGFGVAQEQHLLVAPGQAEAQRAAARAEQERAARIARDNAERQAALEREHLRAAGERDRRLQAEEDERVAREARRRAREDEEIRRVNAAAEARRAAMQEAADKVRAQHLMDDVQAEHARREGQNFGLPAGPSDWAPGDPAPEGWQWEHAGGPGNPANFPERNADGLGRPAFVRAEPADPGMPAVPDRPVNPPEGAWSHKAPDAHVADDPAWLARLRENDDESLRQRIQAWGDDPEGNAGKLAAARALLVERNGDPALKKLADDYVAKKLGGANRDDVELRCKKAIGNVNAQKGRGQYDAVQAAALKDALKAERDRILSGAEGGRIIAAPTSKEYGTAIEQHLATTGDVKIDTRNKAGGGINDTTTGEFGGMGAVIKWPGQDSYGMSGAWDYAHERNAYLLARELDLQGARCPTVVIRKVPQARDGEDRVVMEFVSGGKEAGKVRGYADMVSREEGENMAFYDYLLQNTDRHPGNYMIQESAPFGERLVPIDHGLVMKETTTDRYGQSAFYGDLTPTPEMVAAAKKILANTKLKDDLLQSYRDQAAAKTYHRKGMVKQGASPGIAALGEEEVAALWGRLETVARGETLSISPRGGGMRFRDMRSADPRKEAARVKAEQEARVQQEADRARRAAAREAELERDRAARRARAAQDRVGLAADDPGDAWRRRVQQSSVRTLNANIKIYRERIAAGRDVAMNQAKLKYARDEIKRRKALGL